MAELAPRLVDLLRAIYGEGAIAAVGDDLRLLLSRWRSRLPAATPRGFSERDVVLITYADQIRSPGHTPLETLSGFLERTAADVVNTVHVLPFFPSSSDDGFSVMDYRSVDPAFGTWEDVERLGRRFRLMFDAVINHASVQGDWFKSFLKGEDPYREYFFTIEGTPDLSQVVRPRAHPVITGFQAADGEKRVWTTFSADQADLDYRHPGVLLEMIDILLSYVARGASLLRLDAIAYLWKEVGTACIHLPQTHGIIRLLRAVLDEVAPHVLLITETNVPHADNVSYFGSGSDEAHLVYNFALPPLVMHAILRGTARALSRWAEGLTVPSDDVAFFNFLASHDGIGLNPARGILPEEEIEALVASSLAHGGRASLKRNPDGSTSPYELNINYFDALSPPRGGEGLAVQVRRFLTAHAILLSLPGMPGVYFHSLFGSRGWPEGVEVRGSPRAINRQKLELESIERELSDEAGLRPQVFRGLKRLLSARAASPAFHPAAPHRVFDLGGALFALERQGEGGSIRVVCLHNLTGEAQRIRRSALTLPGGPEARRVAAVGEVADSDVEAVDLGPYASVWISAPA